MELGLTKQGYISREVKSIQEFIKLFITCIIWEKQNHLFTLYVLLGDGTRFDQTRLYFKGGQKYPRIH